MNVPFVDLKRQYLSLKQEIDSRIQKVLDNTAFIGGKNIQSFEESFASTSQAEHCIGVANGTDAIFIALKMLGISQGDEVITSACSWISTSEVISQTGAKPVFVDIKEDYLIDVDQIEAKITAKTKAIIPVHLYGQMADIQSIKTICDKHNLYLIEDCAQAHLSQRDGAKVGMVGDVATFSFYPGKNLGAYGDAGGIITNDTELATKMRMYARHGGLTKHDHQIEGINSRLDNLQAGVLDVKLPHLKEWTEKRRAIADRYFENLGNVEQIQLPIIHQDSYHVYHLFVISADDRDQLKTFLADKGVGTAIHYPVPLPLLPCYQYLGHTPKDFPVASSLNKRILSLPMFPELKIEEQEFVIKSIERFYK